MVPAEEHNISYEEGKMADELGTGDCKIKNTEAAKMNWYEVRPKGRIPERRAYHASCIARDKIYVHGGSDIREGLLGNMWMLQLNFLNPESINQAKLAKCNHDNIAPSEA